MFYVKEKINKTTAITIEIHEDNVFCTCPMCGNEVNVNLAEIFNDSESDLYGTAVYCADCSKLITVD